MTTQQAYWLGAFGTPSQALGAQVASMSQADIASAIAAWQANVLPGKIAAIQNNIQRDQNGIATAQANLAALQSELATLQALVPQQ